MQAGAILLRGASGQKDADARGVFWQSLQEAAERGVIEQLHAAGTGPALLHGMKDAMDILAERPGGFGRAAVNSEDKLLGLQVHKTFL